MASTPLRTDEFLSLYELNHNINGDNVIGFGAPTKLKSVKGFGDYTNVLTYFTSDEDKKNHRKHLGLFELFATTHSVEVPMITNLLEGASVLEVPNGGSVTYDLMIPVENNLGAIAMADTSMQDSALVAGQPFYIILDKQFTPGDRLKFDVQSDFQVVVSREHDIEPSGEYWKHYVIFEAKDTRKRFPKEGLIAGRQWIRTSHALGEYSTQWGGFTGGYAKPGYIRNEVYLPSPQGIETAYTKRGGNMSTMAANTLKQATVNFLETELTKLGGWDSRGMVIMGNTSDNGKSLTKGTAKVASTLEYLAMKELVLMGAYNNMFSTAATEHTEDGVITIAEGAWAQFRRGKVIPYSRPGGMTLNHLQEASNYIFKNSNIPATSRRVTFKGGFEVVQNGLRILQAHANTQLQNVPITLLGTQGQINGKGLVSGDLSSLKLALLEFGEVYLDGVGYTKFEHDASFDYNPVTDRISGGFIGNGYNTTTYSLVVDAHEVLANNSFKNIKGADLVTGGNKNSSLYYLKPEGSHITWGRTYGRMNQGDQYSNLNASLKYMGTEFWASIESSVLLVDTTAKVIIELQGTYLS